MIMRFFLHIFLYIIAVTMVVFGCLLSPAWAASERNQSKTKNIKTSHSCYAHLTMMVQSSSFSITDQLRSSLRLRVERDDAERVLLLALRGENAKNTQQPIGQIGWLLYQSTTHTLKDVSKLMEHEDIETAFSGENGQTLTIDRRFAYLFDQCRRRSNLTQATSCRQKSQENIVDLKSVKLWAQGRVGKADKSQNEQITLYSAPSPTCPISETLALKPGSALKIYHQREDFYFVRQDNFKKDFISGWIRQDHVQNIKFIDPPATAQALPITITPAPKPVSTTPNHAPLLTHIIETEEEENIPVPIMIKPSPDTEIERAASAMRRERNTTTHSTNKRDN